MQNYKTNMIIDYTNLLDNQNYTVVIELGSDTYDLATITGKEFADQNLDTLAIQPFWLSGFIDMKNRKYDNNLAVTSDAGAFEGRVGKTPKEFRDSTSKSVAYTKPDFETTMALLGDSLDVAAVTEICKKSKFNYKRDIKSPDDARNHFYKIFADDPQNNDAVRNMMYKWYHEAGIYAANGTVSSNDTYSDTNFKKLMNMTCYTILEKKAICQVFALLGIGERGKNAFKVDHYQKWIIPEVVTKWTDSNLGVWDYLFLPAIDKHFGIYLSYAAALHYKLCDINKKTKGNYSNVVKEESSLKYDQYNRAKFDDKVIFGSKSFNYRYLKKGNFETIAHVFACILGYDNYDDAMKFLLNKMKEFYDANNSVVEFLIYFKNPDLIKYKNLIGESDSNYSSLKNAYGEKFLADLNSAETALRVTDRQVIKEEIDESTKEFEDYAENLYQNEPDDIVRKKMVKKLVARLVERRTKKKS